VYRSFFIKNKLKIENMLVKKSSKNYGCPTLYFYCLEITFSSDFLVSNLFTPNLLPLKSPDTSMRGLPVGVFTVHNLFQPLQIPANVVKLM